MEAALFVIGVAAVVLLWIFFSAVRIVREFERLVVLRLGRFNATKGPGLVLLIPVVDKATRVDLREDYLTIPKQVCITRDNAPISIDFLIYYRVIHPESTYLQVADFVGASQGIATTTLRAVIGDISLDDVLAKREQINQVLQAKLDEITARWGVKVTSVEIREIDPPREIQEAMNRQMAAERDRRATVTRADGERQANITVAEGEKQAAILTAEGERQAAILRAEGFSLALDKIFQVAQGVDGKTMSLQYLDTLKALGASPSTKFIFPLEFADFARGLGGGASRAQA